jgi:hypothetical protein
MIMFRWLKQPWVITAAQITQYVVGTLGGITAVIGAANPLFLQSTIGPVLISIVGGMLSVGCGLGAVSAIKGWWSWERIALIIVGLAFLALMPAALYFAFARNNPAIWVVVILVVWAICDCIKRYRRIDWAYLDPAK